MEGAVYLLCAATALACAGLLLRGYWRTRARLLMWCGLAFAALALENVALFVDVVLLPHVDLSSLRLGLPLAAVALLFYGLIWESR